jgi:tetratricopeptide (TPR) repeat protein
VESTGDPEAENSIAGAAELSALREGLGDAYFRMSQYPAAMLQYGKALQIIEDPAWRATLQRKRGQVCEKWGRHDLAREYFEAGLRELKGGVDQHEVANIYLGLGLVYYHKGQLEQAVQIGTMALAALEKMGDERGVARALNNLGIAEGKREEWETAIGYHRRGLDILAGLDDNYDLATAHNNIGLALHRSGGTDEAIGHFQQSLDLFERIGNPHGLARACDNLSQAYLEIGEEEESRKYLERAVTLLAEISMDGAEIHPEMWRSGAW